MVKIKTKDLNLLKDKLQTPQKIAVVMHPNPDGDTIGSSIAWSLLLQKLGHKVMTISVDQLPYDLKWLPNIDKVMIYEKKSIQIKDFLSKADMLFCMDFNTPKRLNQLEVHVKNSPAYKVLIDHHLMPDLDFFNQLFSVVNMSSTSELLFILIKKLKLQNLIDVDIATNIFIGIMTDTGSYSYSCNSPETFEHTAQLIRYGLNVKELHDKVYNDNPEDRLRLLGFSINEKLVVMRKHQSAYISLSREELKKFNEKPGFTEGLVNMALSVEGIQFAAMLTEKNDCIKLSFRSKGNLDVNTIAREYFNGGGHKNASGGKLIMSMENAIKEVERVILNDISPRFNP